MYIGKRIAISPAKSVSYAARTCGLPQVCSMCGLSQVKISTVRKYIACAAYRKPYWNTVASTANQIVKQAEGVLKGLYLK